MAVSPAVISQSEEHAMSLNNGITSKQQLRHDELEQIMKDYQQNGGAISRSADKVNLYCHSCGFRRYGSLRYFLTYGQSCGRCGARTRMA
jgi:hypothetical protein